MENKNFGQNSSLINKQIAEIERKLAQIKIENDFYANGVTFTQVQPVSYKNIAGSKWKKDIIEAFGNDIFEKYCDRYIDGNSKKPIDFKIACLKTQYAKYFNPGESIYVQDEKNNYTNNYKCLYIFNDGICIMALPTMKANGTIINVSKKTGCEKAIQRYNLAINDLLPQQKQEQPMKSNFNENELREACAKEDGLDINDPYNNDLLNACVESKKKNIGKGSDSKRKKTIKTVAFITGTLVLAIVALLIYKKYKSKQ